MCFNKWGGCPAEINLKMQRKMRVLCPFFRDFSVSWLNFELFFLRIFLLVWHLWQQKINIAVGRRAPTRVREKEKHNDAVFCHLHYAKRWCRKMFCHFFLDFSLFVGISTHIQIGRETKSKGRKRFIRHLEWWRWKKRKLPNILHIWITTNKCTVMNSGFLYQA